MLRRAAIGGKMLWKRSISQINLESSRCGADNYHSIAMRLARSMGTRSARK
ncbi:MAG: hypothetical protein LH613_18190 [Chamaesiphon sp.]|nr:hypothetical protein [Chamaesiphon sp.]